MRLSVLFWLRVRVLSCAGSGVLTPPSREQGQNNPSPLVPNVRVHPSSVAAQRGVARALTRPRAAMARRGGGAAAALALALALLALAVRSAHAGAGDAAELAALAAMDDKPNTRFPAEPDGAWTTKQPAAPKGDDGDDAPHSSTPQQRLEIAILTLKSAFVDQDVPSNDAVCNPDDAPDPCLCAHPRARQRLGLARPRAGALKQRRSGTRASGVAPQRRPALLGCTRPFGAALSPGRSGSVACARALFRS
jgi:hypothetical protein